MCRTYIKIILAFVLLLTLAGCTKYNYPSTNTKFNHNLQFKPGKDLLGLATPIQLQRGDNAIDLRDYFYSCTIDSVKSDISLPFILDKINQKVNINITETTPPLSNLSLFSGKNKYDILVKSPTKKEHILRLKDNNYSKVQIKGEMNAWNPASTLVYLKDGEWLTKLELTPGAYQYKYIVDGEEITDPNNKDMVSNGSGGMNSLLTLAKPDKKELPWFKTAFHTPSEITLSYTNLPTQIYAYWENTRLEVKIINKTIEIPLPPLAKSKARSFIRVWGYNPNGISNDILIPLQNGIVLSKASDLNRKDKEAQIMYFTLIDRFSNGDISNDDPIEDERLKPLTNYLGGDLAGITEKIKSGYFKELNINSLWLSPITQNPIIAYQEYIDPQFFYSGYHGYWPISSSKVDYRFGNDKSLKELVDVAHDNGINILLDYVTNHVHEEHPIYKKHPNWATNLLLPDGTKNLRLWDDQRLTTWFDEFMPSLNLTKPEVVKAQVDSTIYWLKKFNLDGYRHDATKHIPQKFWKELTRRLKKEVVGPHGRSLYQIGETYGSRELIKSYISSGLLDAQFDFNLYFDAREVFAKSEVSFGKLIRSLEETFSYYGYHSTMGYISGNHDQARFISLASGDVSFSEDHKMAGFNRDIEVTDSLGYDKLEMLMAFIMTIPGVPVIYYGDEIGMPGGGDPDSRRMMRFNNLGSREIKTRELVRKLTELRKNHLALTYGDTEIIAYDDYSMIMKRVYFDQEVILLMNKSNENKSLDIPSNKKWKSHFKGKIRPEANRVISLPPWSFDILTHQ